MGDRPPVPRRRPRLRPDGGFAGEISARAIPSDYLTPVEITAILDSLDEGIVLVDESLVVVAVNRRVVSDTGFRESSIVGYDLERILELDRHAGLRAALAGSTDAFFHRLTGELRTVGGESRRVRVLVPTGPRPGGPPVVALTYTLLDEETAPTDWQARQERLAIINQFNATLRKVTRSIIQPTSRGELEEIVCRELAAATPYEFAVIAESNVRSGVTTVTPRTWAGVDGDVVTDLIYPLERGNNGNCPVTAAVTTGTAQVALHIDRDPAVAECLSHVSAAGISSVAVVPIRFEETIYGVLAVYSAREEPFEDFEVRMLEELGEIVGFVYNAVDKDELLSTDTVVELEFEITDPDSYFVTASAAEDCTMILESVVPTGGGELRYYYRAIGGSPERLVEMAEDSSTIAEATLIRQQGEVSWLVFRLEERSIVEVLTANNVNVRQLEADRGVVKLFVEASPTADLEAVTDAMASRYSDFELVAKRRRERPAFTTPEFRHEVFDVLTDKQREALEAAFQHGYFERPRGNTAEEIAAQLGIASSTFHQHLRAAMSKLMVVLLETDTREHRVPRR